MALLVQVLVLLLAGVLEVGRVLEVWVVTTNAAREGARLAALGQPIGAVQQRAYDYLTTSLAGRTDVVLPDLASIAVTNAGGLPGDPVTVDLTTGVLIMTPLIQNLFPTHPVPVRGVLTMRLQ
ncbi:MAG: pilus assembly protein [Chloroflexi bacterium]|nr:pilus assembly protein [Chloroflexota bacterium]